MSTPSAPNGPHADSPAERRANDAPARRDDAPAQGSGAGPFRQGPSGARDDDRSEPERERYGPVPPDRAAEADLLIDIPQITVEELALELDASHMLNRVKLDAKGLDAGLFVKANLDSLLALGLRGSDRTDRASGSLRGTDVMRRRGGLRELLGAAREAYRDLSDRDVQRQPRDVHESAREAQEHVVSWDEVAPASLGADEDARERDRHRNGDDARMHAVRERLRHVAGQGVKAAGLTAAGLAGGALLESRSKASRKLLLPRRRNRAQVVLRQISRRLP
jgi:hypothetical protein